MRKQACRKCIFWELMIKEGITNPWTLESLRCEFETHFDNPKDEECRFMDLSKMRAKMYELI